MFFDRRLVRFSTTARLVFRAPLTNAIGRAKPIAAHVRSNNNAA
jgi:hypothetical protein